MKWVVFCLLAVQLVGCSLFRPRFPETVAVQHERAVEGLLYAGAAAVDITPKENLWMGGYNILRKADGVHDPLYARAVVLKRGDLELGIVMLDVVGLQHQDVLRIREKMSGIDGHKVILASTHNHNGPDTVGIWGFPPFSSGQDDDYMVELERGVLEAVSRARAELREAEVATGVALAPLKGLHKNLRRPGMIDREVVVMHLREPETGKTIATLTELGCHPEVLERWNRQVTADYPHWTIEKLEKELGGMAMYLSGALGALVAPDVERSEPPIPEQEWAEAKRVGNLLADLTLSTVETFQVYDRKPTLAYWLSPIFLKNENSGFDIIRWTGVLDRDLYRGGYFRSEVVLWQVGGFRLATVPGEITPALGMRIKENAGGTPTMLVGLANDELGYLLPRSDYHLPLYDYERSLCIGIDAADRIVARLKDLSMLAGN